MCLTHYTITPKDIYRYAASVTQPHLRWPDHGPECTVTTLPQVMFHAAAQLPGAVKNRRWRLAIDLNLRPYYGQAHRRTEERYRSQAKTAPPTSMPTPPVISCTRVGVTLWR